MDTARTMSITEGRKRIFDLAEKAQVPGAYFTLTEKGKPRVVLMSAEEFESWTETMEVERIFPRLDQDIADVKKALKTGAWKEWTTLEEIEKKWAIKPVAQIKKKHGISSARHKKIGKGA
jgi:prevent-host-death family protein